MFTKNGFFPGAVNSKHVLLFNYIHYDGIGDFNHLIDFSREFTPLAKKLRVKLILFVVSTGNRKELVEQRLKTSLPTVKAHVLELGENSGDNAIEQFSHFIHNNKELREELSTTCCIFQISTSMAKAQKDIILKLSPCEIPVVIIPEISGLRTSALNLPISYIDPRDQLTPRDLQAKNINTRCLGLQKVPYQYGLKIKRTYLPNVMALENRDFFKHLTGINDSGSTCSEEMLNWANKPQLVPAYLQDWDSITRFMSFCFQRFQGAEQERLVIYLNNPKYRGETPLFSNTPYCLLSAGKIMYLKEHQLDHLILNKQDKQFLPFMDYNLIFGPMLAVNANISAIEININGTVRRINCYPETSCNPPKTVSILTDFNLNDADYDILIANATDIVGVSGDNTIEKALTHDKLPFLQPNNKENFESVMNQLAQLAKCALPTEADNLVKDFEAFFCQKLMRLDKPQCSTRLLEINIQALFKVWHIVVDHLRENYNIFNHIAAIFCEPLVHYCAKAGDINLLHSINEHFGNIDFHTPNKQGETAGMIAEKNSNYNFLDEWHLLMHNREQSVAVKTSIRI